MKRKKWKKHNSYIIFEEDINSFVTFNMCFMNDMLGKAMFAENLHATPIFKVKNMDGINLFEEFYAQQSIENKKCILGEKKYRNAKKLISGAPFDISYKPDEQKLWNLVYNNNFHLKRSYFNDFEKTYQEIRNKVSGVEGGLLIGIEYRGTDYRTLQPKGHPIQPSIDDIIKYISDYSLQDCFFFISTEEENALDSFKNRLGSKVLYVNRNYYDAEFYKEENAYTHVTQVSFNIKNSQFQQGYEYLREVYILSKCDGIIGSNCGATRMAMIMNGGKYNIKGIANLGFY